MHESGGTGIISMQLNGDTGSNYTAQFLRSSISTVSAGSSTGTSHTLVNSTSTGKVNTCECIIYPKSGADRPQLTSMYERENSLDFFAQWYNDTVSEITSIKVYASSTSTKTGKLKLWHLK